MNVNQDQPAPGEQETADLLDDYLARLQAGERPARDELLRRRPELASMLDCLDALESFAPAGDESAAHTVPWLMGDLTANGPTTIGDYELLAEIGRGGMGIVYRARQKSLERIVALKMVLAAGGATPEQLRRFHAEARAAAGLSHPNIVRIFDAGEAEGRHFFAMEYIAGESLAQRMARAPLAPSEAVELVAEVADAVEYLHSQQVIHRDLKPSNILISAQGRPLVTDFGLAKILETDSTRTASGVIAGTPSYMAPEQASGRQADVGPAADVYSLGAILYELLTGRPPFRAESPLDTVLQVLSGEPVPPRKLNPQIDPTLEHICLKCLEKRPQDRYRTAAALADELERYLRGEPIHLEAPDIWQRVWRWVRREPALASRLIVLAAFYLVQQFNYRVFHSSDATFHWQVSLILAIWVFVSLAAGRLVKRRGWALRAGFVWSTVDCALLLLIVWLAHSAASPLVMIFPLLIAGSGLWFRVRLVWYTTAIVVASYLALVVDYHVLRSDPLPGLPGGVAQHVIYVATFVLLGGVTAYQAQRVRSLNRYLHADESDEPSPPDDAVT